MRVRLLLLLEKLRGLAGDGGGVVDGEIAEGEPTNPHSSHGVIVVVGALASPKAACVLTLTEGRGWDAMVVESGADDEASGSIARPCGSMCGSICACEAIRYDPRSPALAGKGVGTGKEVDSKAFPSGAFWLGATTTLSLFVASFWIFAIVVAITSKRMCPTPQPFPSLNHEGVRRDGGCAAVLCGGRALASEWAPGGGVGRPEGRRPHAARGG